MASAAREKAQKVVSRMLVMLTMASIAVLGIGVWHVLDAPVRGFVVDGELSTAERTELQEALAATPLHGILSTSLATVTQTVQSLPWAREISVRRQWPDQLVVTLHKANPMARWGEDRYLSAFGDLLTLPDNYVGLPRFDVSVASPVAAMEVYRLLDQIAARENLAIAQLRQNAQGEWSLNLAHGPEVVLGAEQLNERMHRFLLLYRRVLSGAERPVAYIDARYANGLAVRFIQADAQQQLSAAQAEKVQAALVARSDQTHLTGDERNGG